MLGEHVDLVAGDFNGAAWRCSNRNNISTIEEAFADCALPTPPGSTPLWGPGSIPGCWADVCRFLKPPKSDRYWKVRLHGAFSIPHEAPGLRPTDQSCHHVTLLHLDFVDWREGQSQREKHNQRIPFFPVVDHPYRMHIHHDHLDTASFKKKVTVRASPSLAERSSHSTSLCVAVSSRACR